MALEVRIPSGGKIQPFFTPIEVLEIGGFGMPGELIIHNGKLYVYGETGATLIDGGIIQTEAILAGSITADKLSIGGQSFAHNIAWTAVDENTCSWNAGTIQWADGTMSDIDAGNTGNISNTTYIYYNETSVLQTTTDFSQAISDTKKLLAIIELGGSGAKCIITPIYSTGTTISGNKITTGKIQSIDGETYFDLNEGRILISDTIVARVLIGRHDGGF